jgi:two-component system sensor histidine kinase KdpD
MPWKVLGGTATRYVAAVALTAAAAEALRLMPAISARAAAPMLLLAVLVVARSWGIGPAIVSAVSTSAGYSYYFLPMAGLSADAVRLAFITFTFSVAIVAWLAARAEQRRREALAGRVEIERLYQQLQSAFDRASEVEADRRNEQLKAALLDALTHNLRTPLTSIKAAVTALIGPDGRTGWAGLSVESRRELLQVIDEESDRLNRFVEGLSAAERLDGEHPAKHQGVAVEDVIAAGVARARTVTARHRVRIDLPDMLPTVAVDAAAVAEVIYMLLDNASKYAPENSEIRVAALRVDALHVSIEVADEGPGVPPALRERVFEKFYRVPGREPIDSQRAGIGLGLSIARRLVEAQGGRLWIQASPSGGTAVMMTLPGAPAAPPVADAASAAHSPTGTTGSADLQVRHS